MRARKLVFLILLTTFSFSVKAQFPLDVHLLPQQGTYYCWAACTEMIVDYYHRQNAAIPLYTQCEIATNWLESRRIITNPTATPFTIAECCPTPCPNTVNSFCNYNMTCITNVSRRRMIN